MEQGRYAAFGRGFRAILPLWLGAIPFGLAYAVTARSAGLSVGETQLMSLTVFAGASQVSAVGMIASGKPALAIILTTLLLNIRHLLYGLSLGRAMVLSWSRRIVAAYFLTDEAYGVTIVSRGNFGFLLGAELSMFVVWNSATLVGAILGGGIKNPLELGVDFVFPLAFLALLIPMIRSRVEIVVAIVAGLSALAVNRFFPSLGSSAVLIAGLVGSFLGAWLTRANPSILPSDEVSA